MGGRTIITFPRRGRIFIEFGEPKLPTPFISLAADRRHGCPWRPFPNPSFLRQCLGWWHVPCGIPESAIGVTVENKKEGEEKKKSRRNFRDMEMLPFPI